MSLHALADHMASRGRGPDTTLVHMAPQEVAGLQALALAHGGSLTINPDTGLPEAGFLKKLLPALAGFALNAFAPGFGTAIGGMLGLGGAAGTAIGLGGITGLATGSLSKGLMAGMGAYGGASLASGVMGAGAASGLDSALANAGTAEGLQGEAFNKFLTSDANPALMSNADKLGAGFNAITKDPSAFGNFAKQNAGALLGVTSPLLADQGVDTVTKIDNPGYIRNFEVDLLTQRAKALDPVSVKSLGYPGYAGGGEIGAPKTITQMPGTSPYRDSQAAYEYLMGIAPKAPQQNTQTQTQTSINPAAEGRYSWDSDKKAYTFIPANGGTETTPTPAPALNYEFGGDSGSGAGGGSGGVGTAGAGVSASDSADFGDTSSSNSDSSSSDSSSSDSSSSDGAAAGDAGASGGGGGGAAGGDGEANGGLMRLHKKFAEGGATSVRDGSAQAAYNYLMGLTNSTRPDAPAYTPQPVYIPPTPAKKDDDLPTLNPFTPVTGGGGGGGGGGASPIIGGGLTTLPTTTTTPVMPSPDADFPSTYPQPVMPSPDADFPSTYPQPVMPSPDADFPSTYTQPTLPNSDDFRTASGIDDATISVDNPYVGMDDSARATDIDNATIAVDVPNTGVTAMDDGTTQVVMDQIAQQQPAAQATVQDEPNGGAVVTMPDQTPIDSSVADTFNPNTGTYVEVGNAGGDFGGRMIDAESDGNSIDEDEYDYQGMAQGGMLNYAMGGGLGSLGGYSDGGRLLRGPGDGVSDSIPAMIGKKQPARLADGEFVVPARIVSELGNGSTEAGARKLYKMMDRIQAARGKTVGKGRVAKNSRAEKHLPA